MSRFHALFVLLALTACGGEPPVLPSGVLRIGGTELVVEIARRPADRRRGLSGRPALEAGRGMLFAYDQPRRPEFTMRNMAFDLDLVWIREGRVVGISSRVSASEGHPARTYPAPEAVDAVLEVRSGTAEAEDWQVGTSVRLLGDPPLQAR